MFLQLLNLAPLCLVQEFADDFMVAIEISDCYIYRLLELRVLLSKELKIDLTQGVPRFLLSPQGFNLIAKRSRSLAQALLGRGSPSTSNGAWDRTPASGNCGKGWRVTHAADRSSEALVGRSGLEAPPLRWANPKMIIDPR